MTEKIVTGKEMKQLDEHTIKVHGMPSLVLMERAALASVDVLHEEGFDLDRVTVICGQGNNGGDGIAVARLLYLAGHDVSIIFIGDPEKRSAETKQQQEIAESYGICISPLSEKPSPLTIIDAIFGIGSVRAPEGEFLEAVRYINRRKNDGAKVLSLDIPSGVDADTGETPGDAVAADVTVTFAYKKTGLTLSPGIDLAGKIIVKDIGIYI